MSRRSVGRLTTSTLSVFEGLLTTEGLRRSLVELGRIVGGRIPDVILGSSPNLRFVVGTSSCLGLEINCGRSDNFRLCTGNDEFPLELSRRVSILKNETSWICDTNK